MRWPDAAACRSAVPPLSPFASSDAGHIHIYPLSAETLEPLARFVRKLPKDSNLAEDGFPGLINQEFSSRLAPHTQFVQLGEPDKLVYFLEFSINRRPN